MKKFAIFCLVLLGACSQNGKSKTQHVIDTSQEMPYVFVISASSGTFSNETLSIKAVPVAVYFSDRPHLVAGHLTLSNFVASWKNGSGAKVDDSPNAVLSILEQGKESEIILELSCPKILGKTLHLKVEKSSGEIPMTFGPSSVFIEMKGLSPSKASADSES